MSPDYVVYDYEDVNADGKTGFWHIYSTDQEDAGILENMSVFTIQGPKTEEMKTEIAAICSSINRAVALVMEHRHRNPNGP